MTDAKNGEATATQTEGGAEAIDASGYELLRNRLDEQATALRDRAAKLNEQRVEVFGGAEMAVVGNERIRTENNCVARDVVGVADNLLFGYNVFIGLRKEVRIDDVFSQHRFPQGAAEDGFAIEPIQEANAEFLNDPRFIEDFHNLYRYYKNARLIALRELSTRVLAVFQIGHEIDDIKVLRWRLAADGSVSYLDDRGAEDHVFPDSHDFQWKVAGREDFVFGTHPHINILDEVFVETVGGDLTIKVEDNTEDGWGIYREPVDDADQALDDAKVLYVKVGILILIKVLPFAETKWRYFVFNTRSQAVHRIDAIGQACLQLPEEHGIIFPGGYCLETGEAKTFEGDVSGMRFARMVKSPNGEDVLYVFYEDVSGRSILLPYNLIRKEVQNPINCHGYSLFDDGKLLVFRTDSEEPTRVHPMQIWQTPFTGDVFAAKTSVAGEHAGSYLVKVGNADLVRGISDCHSLFRMVRNQKPSTRVYEDLIRTASTVNDNHFWLGHQEVGNLAGMVQQIGATAELIVDEFEKVKAIQKGADEALTAAQSEVETLLQKVRPDLWKTVDPYIAMMDELRGQRGRLITLREMRYIKTEQVLELEQKVAEGFEGLTGDVVRFLQRDDALQPYRDKQAEIAERIDNIDKTSSARPIAEELDTTASNLDLLTEVVSTLQIDDPQVRVRILEEVSEVFALVNRAKATLEGRRKKLATTEGVSEFGAQFKLFAQTVQSAVAMADTPEKCEEQLTRLMVQLEDLEARFSEFDQFLTDLATKREEVYETFASRKQRLLDERNRRADHMVQAAQRILSGVARRATTFKTVDELNAYFAADAMVLKVRDLAESLTQLGDTMRSEEVIARLKGTRDESVRVLRDRSTLVDGDDNTVKFGQHRFSINSQDLELTLLPRNGRMHVHLTGTGFMEPLDDPELDAVKEYWTQSLISENDEVYRGEYLAVRLFFAAEAHDAELSIEKLMQAQQQKKLLELVRNFAAERYDEGYDRGVHDQDAALILDGLISLYTTSGLLRFAPRPRALGLLFWAFGAGDRAEGWSRTAKNLGRLRRAFTAGKALADLAGELGKAVQSFAHQRHIDCRDHDARIAGKYLSEELAKDREVFTTSAEAVTLRDALLSRLDDSGGRAALEDDLLALEGDLETRFSLALRWIAALVEVTEKESVRRLRPAVWEAAALLLTEKNLEREVSSAQSTVMVKDLLGQHRRINDRTMPLRLDEILERLGAYVAQNVPAFEEYRSVRNRIVQRERERLRLEELKPRVLSSFVRNRLIDQVYLPLIGDNLAKQMGAQGDNKRTDLMGMLLLISPPGYGKTTLMEYIANTLGLVFVKVNGPALGHLVTSLDPQEAPNATARQELDKLGLALEMGNNVMLYVDDIQHTSPEFLQKFISLCDAQRRIEGVWKNRTKTYDLKGKRFCVCMAGNPYTESGEKFQIPDMLANRADVYNLGDVLSGKESAFALSYIENALTSNTVLAPLAGREFSDVYNLVRMAEGEEVPASALKHGYSKAEQSELVSIFEKLFAVRDVLLRVNETYISSASQDDRFRTEPRFQLQGSYRNMAKLAQRIVGVMNDDELQALIDDHYMGESQTLTSGAEANILKLKELRGRLSPQEAQRWAEIKKGFAKLQWAGGADDDPVTRVTKQISGLSGHVEGVRESIESASQMSSATQDALLPAIHQLTQAIEFAVSSQPASGERTAGSKGITATQKKKLNKVRGLLDKVLAAAQTAGEDDPVILPPGTVAQLWQAVKTLEDVG